MTSEAETAQVALNALTEIGLDRVVGDDQAWITVTPEFVLKGLVYSLPRKARGARAAARELLATSAPRTRRRATQRRVHDRARRLSHTSETEPLLGSRRLVKLDLAALGPDVLAQRGRAQLTGRGADARGRKGGDARGLRARARGRLRSVPGLLLLPAGACQGPSGRAEPLALMRLASALQDPRPRAGRARASDLERRRAQLPAAAVHQLGLFRAAPAGAPRSCTPSRCSGSRTSSAGRR